MFTVIFFYYNKTFACIGARGLSMEIQFLKISDAELRFNVIVDNRRPENWHDRKCWKQINIKER